MEDGQIVTYAGSSGGDATAGRSGGEAPMDIVPVPARPGCLRAVIEVAFEKGMWWGLLPELSQMISRK